MAEKRLSPFKFAANAVAERPLSSQDEEIPVRFHLLISIVDREIVSCHLCITATDEPLPLRVLAHWR
jgi:hypothetical protein